MNNERDSPAYRQFVKAVFTRDKNKCVICKSRRKLHAHHLNGWHWFPQGRYDPNNAVTLCGHRTGCHILFHQLYGKKLNTKQQFDQFLNYMKFMKKKPRKPPKKP
jgi:hypothetical protein